MILRFKNNVFFEVISVNLSYKQENNECLMEAICLENYTIEDIVKVLSNADFSEISIMDTVEDTIETHQGYSLKSVTKIYSENNVRLAVFFAKENFLD